MQFWEKFALTTIEIALGFASCNFSVTMKFFSQIALSSMRLHTLIRVCLIHDFLLGRGRDISGRQGFRKIRWNLYVLAGQF